jgi:hypothetical protein
MAKLETSVVIDPPAAGLGMAWAGYVLWSRAG